MPRLAIHRTSALLVALILGSLPGWAAERALSLDPEATEIDFVLEATGHDVHGDLALRRGEIRFDADTGQASGALEIDARSAETGSKSRDETMHEKVLESEGNPLIVFRPDRVSGDAALTGDGKITLHGTLVLLGKEHPIDLPAEVKVEGDRLQARVSFAVPYVAWGLHDPSVFVLRVAKEVQVTVEARGSLHETSTASFSHDG